jgi:hypothetical protein
MSNLYRTILLAALCLSTAALALPPQRVVIEYEVKYSGRLSAEATAVAELSHDGKRYSLLEQSKGRGVAAVLLPGVLRRSATGAVSAEGLKPSEFRDQRGSRPENLARFDWVRGILTHVHDGKTESQAMPDREVLNDRLSFLWTFAFRPADAVKAGREVRAVLSDGRGLSTFRYMVSGPETLQTPAGALRTVKLVKQRDPGDERATEIWLATERDNVPVRILVVEQDGTRMDTVVARFGA